MSSGAGQMILLIIYCCFIKGNTYSTCKWYLFVKESLHRKVACKGHKKWKIHSLKFRIWGYQNPSNELVADISWGQGDILNPSLVIIHSNPRPIYAVSHTWEQTKQMRVKRCWHNQSLEKTAIHSLGIYCTCNMQQSCLQKWIFGGWFWVLELLIRSDPSQMIWNRYE